MAKKMNWAQARNRTDSGRTHDKVDYPDPAAAPLGTDEEAGGTRTSTDEIGQSVEQRESVDAKKSRSKDPGRQTKP